jgi:hypothetical protein
MNTRKLWLVALGLAGVLECGMALYHFVLPYHMGWAQGHGVENLPDSMAWALYALNFSWSLLLLSVSSLVIHAATLGPTGGTFMRRSIFTVGLFWAIHGSYVWLNPMPLPQRLLWLKFVLAAFPATLVLLHWIPLMVGDGRREPVARAIVGVSP